MKKLLILLGFAVLVSSLLGTSQLAFAEKWLASGEITNIIDDEGFLDGVLGVGDPWSQEIEIDPATPDSEPADLILGVFRYDNTHVALGDDVTYGNLPPLGEFDDVCIVLNDAPADIKAVQDFSLQQLSGPTLPSEVFIFWFIEDDDGTVFDSDALPPGETDISEFEFTEMIFVAEPDGNNFDSPTVSLLENGKPLSLEDILETNQQGFVFIEGDVQSLIMIEEVVGGELLPIDSTALLLAGLSQSSIWMIPVIVSAIGIGIVIARKF